MKIYLVFDRQERQQNTLFIAAFATKEAALASCEYNKLNPEWSIEAHELQK